MVSSLNERIQYFHSKSYDQLQPKSSARKEAGKVKGRKKEGKNIKQNVIQILPFQCIIGAGLVLLIGNS